MEIETVETVEIETVETVEIETVETVVLIEQCANRTGTRSALHARALEHAHHM